MVDIETTRWFIQQLTGDMNAVVDWRCIHDKDAGVQGVNLRGTIDEKWPQLMKFNEDGYGVFCNINAMDGQGSEYANVAHIRTAVVDLDNTVTAEVNYSRAGSGTFAVQSSPGKFHVYWRTEPYTGNEFFTHIQRKLAQLYDGDRSIKDATRVMRVPGFLHQKNDPHLVTGWPLSGHVYTAAQLDEMLAGVNVVEHLSSRNPLGSPELSAPNLEVVKAVMDDVDPNDMDRTEWLSMSASIKQAAWLHADEETIYQMWSAWCGQYGTNDDAENRKLWGSLKDTEVGWKSLLRRSTNMTAHIKFYGHDKSFEPMKPKTQVSTPPLPTKTADEPVDEAPPEYGEILSEYECEHYFKNCYFINTTGKIFTPSGRSFNSGQFSGVYGGKQFIITSTGKCTDDAWKAVTRSTLWTIPKVDHTRFLPELDRFAIVRDEMGRKGLNTYIPINQKRIKGDVTPWLQHMDKMLPNKQDQKILFDFMAHNVKFPGYKIPWSPMIQSAEGIGKTVFIEVMSHAIGQMYTYIPKADQLVNSGSTFNAWMKAKLMIMVNEIKVDERRELIEILKPMISDARVEVQAKGENQEMEDNLANWFFFSNHRDAIPITKDGRRYAIFYSVLQTAADIARAGMDDAYFANLFKWLKNDGYEIITDWLMDYPIERGDIPMRAPITSSTEEAVRISRSPMEVVIADCVQDGVTGFRGGYISTISVIQRCKAAGIRQPRVQSVMTCLQKMEYMHIGRAEVPYMQEDVNNRAEVFAIRPDMTVDGYAKAQGY